MHTPFRLAALLALLAPLALAEPPGPPSGPPGGGPPGGGGGPGRLEGPVSGSGIPAATREAIAWYGTWKGALAEAQRSGRPILLMAAAPQCHGISGVW